MSFAIYFEPADFGLGADKIMGRRVAGNAFLRAAAEDAIEGALGCYTGNEKSADAFSAYVASIDPRRAVRRVRPDQLQALGEIGTLFFPSPAIAEMAYRRLRAGPRAWSIVGITHTLCTHVVLDAIAECLVAPVFPWDAIICTSRVAHAAVRRTLAWQAEYLGWRLGAAAMQAPELPIIPLGVHCDDFAFGEAERQTARAQFDIGEGEVVALFAGRLSLHAKAHPHAMFAALETTARASGVPLVLILAGMFSNPATKDRFFAGLRTHCPSLRVRWVSGDDDAAYRQAWRAADLFVSLADNVQETFGLTPIEAMAAGLPLVVTDWNGYRDTVEDGVTGFRIPTWMPESDAGEEIARSYETGLLDYDFYVGISAQFVALDQAILAERLGRLVRDRELRRQMGEAGRRRARADYDWPVIMGRYHALFDELARIRADRGALGDAPPARPTRRSPFGQFAEFATARIDPSTRIALAAPDVEDRMAPMLADPLFSALSSKVVRGRPERLRDIARIVMESGEITLADLERRAGHEETALLVAYMAKIGWLRLSALP